MTALIPRKYFWQLIGVSAQRKRGNHQIKGTGIVCNMMSVRAGNNTITWQVCHCYVQKKLGAQTYKLVRWGNGIGRVFLFTNYINAATCTPRQGRGALKWVTPQPWDSGANPLPHHTKKLIFYTLGTHYTQILSPHPRTELASEGKPNQTKPNPSR